MFKTLLVLQILSTAAPALARDTTIGLFTREGNEIHLYDGANWKKIGIVEGEPFDMISRGTILYTREGDNLHTYSNGAWKKIGIVGNTPFEMKAVGDTLFTREGNELHKYENETWTEIGVVDPRR